MKIAPRCVSPFLAWGDFHARSRFVRSTIPEEKWRTTRSLCKSLRRNKHPAKTTTNELGPALQNIAGNFHISDKRESLLVIQIQERRKFFLAATKFTFQKKLKKMLSIRIRGKIMPTRNTPQKINMRVTTSQYETSGKNNAHLLSCNLPAGEKIHWNKQHFGTRYKSCVA